MDLVPILLVGVTTGRRRLSLLGFGCQPLQQPHEGSSEVIDEINCESEEGRPDTKENGTTDNPNTNEYEKSILVVLHSPSQKVFKSIGRR